MPRHYGSSFLDEKCGPRCSTLPAQDSSKSCLEGLATSPHMLVNFCCLPGDLSAMTTKTVTDQSFASDVLGSEGPVLVDFWAEWCGPCRMIAPALEEIAGELGEKVTIAKLNIDENPDTPGRYGVRGIPTMLLFKGGQPVAQKVGAAPRSQIQQWLEGNL